jgi:hypothetical protein
VSQGEADRQRSCVGGREVWFTVKLLHESCSGIVGVGLVL